MWQRLLSPDFMPHGYCYLWDPWIVWLHVISDSFITLAYYCIPVVLVYFIRKQRDLSFNRIFWMFAVFILACGTTHFMEVWNIWHGSYLLSGILKAITAGASVMTALALLPLIPKMLSLQGHVHLQEVNRELVRQIEAHKTLRERMADAPLRRRLAIGFVVAVILTAVSGFLSWRGQRITSRRAEVALRDSAVINLLQTTLKDVVDVETGARGFSLTGEEAFLEPYYAGQRAQEVQLKALHRLGDDSDLDALNQLQTLVGRSSAIATQIVASRRQQQTGAGLALFEENKKRVDAVRDQIGAMLSAQRQTLAHSSQQTAAEARSTRFVTIAGAMVGICFLGLASIALNREIRTSAGSRAQLWELNNTLEQRVEERTAALQIEIAERKSVEAAKLRLAAIVESSSDAIIGKDLASMVTSWNKGAQQLFGYSAEEILGRSITLLIPPARAHEEKAILDRIRSGEQVGAFETVRVRKDGRAIEISANIFPVKGPSGKVIGAAQIARDITERKQIEAELQKSLADSERTLKELADQKFALDQHAIVAITDVQGTINYVNDKFCAISQYSREELIGNNHRILNSSHHSKEFFQHMYRTIASGKVWHDEIKNRAKDGSFYWVDTTIVPTLSAAGKPQQYVAIRADITERKRAEAALSQSDLRRRLALETARLGDWGLDLTTLKATRSLLHDEIFGYLVPPPEWNFDIFLSHVHPEDRERVRADFQSCASQKKRWEFECRIVCPNDDIRWIWACGDHYCDISGAVTDMFGVVADITERKQIEAELQKSLAASEQALKEVADQKFALDQHAIVAITDVQGTIHYVNQKFCAISQYSREELIGNNHRILNSGHHPREFFQQMYRTIAGGRVWHDEIKNRAKDGSFYWVDTTIVPTLNASGKPQQYVAIRADISERKRAETALEKQKEELARSNADLEQFAYAASHDLQEPLRAVSGCMHLLQARYQDKIDERANEYIHHAVDGAGRMQNLIDDLLSFSRVGTRGGEFLPVDCATAVESALKNLSLAVQESQAQVERGPLPTISGDLSQLSLLFQNLIGNALKFRGLEAPHIFIDAEQHPTEWVISVHDNGIGIEPQYFERVFVIFQRLHTRKEYPGTGMGLALCRKIVERHGGRIWVESQTGKGTTFRFTLPLPSSRLAPIG